MEKTLTNDWIDISVALQEGMAQWPGDPAFSLDKDCTIKDDNVNVSSVSICLHTGTHIDAPLHYIENGVDISSLDLNKLVGLARVIEIKNSTWITIEELQLHGIKKGDRILFKTKNSSVDWILHPFLETFVALTNEAAEYLAATGVALVGIDYLSISGVHNAPVVHQALLGSGVCIVEGLNLSEVTEGNYDLVCLPVKIKNADGAPGRVIIRKIQ